jgi:hypothetical protein
VLAVCAAALVCAGGSAAARTDSPTTQELTIAVSGGVQLSCGLVLPAGSPPAGGWPGLLVFPSGFGLTHGVTEFLAQNTFAPAGFASLTCDPRGTGSSGGSFDLAGPADVADTQALFDWLAARPDVSDTEIGAFGARIGGAEVWNAAAAGVPFKAIVPADTWTSLKDAAYLPNGLESSAYHALANSGPPADWSSAAGLAARSSRPRLGSLAVPTLIVQPRQDLGLLFDLDQATAAYKLLAGPKRLYIGGVSGIGRPTHALPEVVAWFEEHLASGPAVGSGVEIEHFPWDGNTTTFAALPPTRHVSVNLPGTTRLNPQSTLKRSVRLPGGPLETFGAGSLTVRYSDASPGWSELVAIVTVPQNHISVIEGAAPIATPSGVVRIPLLDEVALVPRGRRIAVTVQSASPSLASVFQSTAPPPGSTITVTRLTLSLSILDRAVSR